MGEEGGRGQIDRVAGDAEHSTTTTADAPQSPKEPTKKAIKKTVGVSSASIFFFIFIFAKGFNGLQQNALRPV